MQLTVFTCLVGLVFLPCLCNASPDYGGVGGPLAKSAKKPLPSKTRTTAFPDVDEGPMPPGSFRDENSYINAAMIKVQNWTMDAIVTNYNFTHTLGQYGDMCCWEVLKGQVLSDVAEGKAVKPNYGHAGLRPCATPEECVEHCEQKNCNYIAHSPMNGSSDMYVVHKDILSGMNGTYFQPHPGINSYVRHCLRPYDMSPNCTELTPTNCELCDDFLAFVHKFKKTYKGCEFLRRFEIFKMNNVKIYNLNEKRVTDEDASFTITQFTDKTHEEFLQESTGAKFDMGSKKNDSVLNVGGMQSLFLRFNWADYHVIPPPRDQLECGSCYAFTTTDLLAAQYAIDHGEFGKSYILAPQYLLECMPEPAAFGCDGGRPVLVLKQLSYCGKQVNNGSGNGTAPADCEFPLESCWPYQNNASKSCSKPSCPGAPKIKVEQFNMVDLAESLEKQKIASLLSRGPLVVQVDASDAWQFYEDGIIRPHQCGTLTNHAVLVTGYDFGTDIPGYIIRNTWGEMWGQKGYIFVEAGRNTCGVAQTVTYACTENCDVSGSLDKPFSKYPQSHAQEPNYMPK